MINVESALGRQLLGYARAARGPRQPQHTPDAEALLAVGHYLDLAITPAAVVKGTGAVVRNGTAGVAITAGQTVYEDASDGNKVKLADADLSAAAATLKGVALHAAAAGQPIAYQDGGNLTLNAVLTAGKVYVLSATAGGIAPVADLAAGWRTSLVGIALSTTSLMLLIANSDTVN